MTMDTRLPVNVLTGYLGSGKTTLLNRLLRDSAFAGCAVLINEFGEVGIDHYLVEVLDTDVVLLQSGCICCTVRGDLAASIRSLLDRRERGAIPAFSRLMVETTGLADPVPVMSTVLHDPMLRHHFRLGGVIATVDAMHGLDQLASRPEGCRQVAVADRLVLTKADLAPMDQIIELRRRLREINPMAEAALSVAQQLRPAELLSDDVFTETGKADDVARWLRVARSRRYFPVHGGDQSSHGTITAFVLRLDHGVDWAVFSLWLSLLLHRLGDRILRIKGIVHVDATAKPVVIHGVHKMMHAPRHLERWPISEDEKRESSIVFIVDGLSAEQIQVSWQDFRNALAAESA